MCSSAFIGCILSTSLCSTYLKCVHCTPSLAMYLCHPNIYCQGVENGSDVLAYVATSSHLQ